MRSFILIALVAAASAAPVTFLPGATFAPAADCSIATGLQCAKGLSKCISQCKTGVKACVECLGGDFATCCPCIKKADPKFPISCPSVTKPAANQTHYGDPANGCEADEQAVQVQGVSGKFCSPDCASAACPTDVPAGVTAAPQCALKTSAGDKKCALICSPSTKWSDLRAGDAMCGTGTCQAIQGTGLCTYGGSAPSPSPPAPPSGECGIATGLQCAKSIATCVAPCKTGVKACVACLAGDFATCCPCIKKADPKFPISCPSMPVTMTLDVSLITAANQTHYGDPAVGCEADEQAVQVQGLAGKFCSPDCASAACPTDVPAGVTAAPQCALKTSAGDKKCALICSASTDLKSLRAGDAMCGKATCQPIQGTGICTYGAAPGPSPPGPPPSGECGLATGLECAKSLATCVAQCKTGVKACVACLAGDFATCCPCIKKIDPKFPIACPSSSVPHFMTLQL